MIFRLLSGVGAFAHLGDAVLSPFLTFKKLQNHLVARGARVAGALVIGVVFAILGAGSVANGNEGAANPTPTTYTIAELADNHDLGGKVYATVTATLADEYVRVTKDGSYDHSEFIIGDPTTNQCLVVVSRLTEPQMSARLSADGTVTLTGMLRTDSSEIQEAIDTLGTDASSFHIDTNVLLREGDTPANPTQMYALAVALFAIALLLLVGWAIGYLVFRPAKARQGFSTSGMTEAIPVHVTGLVPQFTNGIRTREKGGELRLATFMADASQAHEAPVDIVFKTRAGNRGLRLMPGLTSARLGKAYPLKGSRPAIRLHFGRYKLILSFDTEQARDMAFDQLRISSRLMPSADGTTLGA